MCSRVTKDVSRRNARRKTTKLAQPSRNRRVVQWAIVFVASLIIADGFVGERGLLAMLQARHEYDQLAATIARQRSENERLREQIRRLNDDPGAIEEIARRELGLIKPGEKVFIIRDVGTPPVKP
jgi:cell division protein FtsB